MHLFALCEESPDIWKGLNSFDEKILVKTKVVNLNGSYWWDFVKINYIRVEKRRRNLRQVHDATREFHPKKTINKAAFVADNIT